MDRKVIPLPLEENESLKEKVYHMYLNSWELPPQALAPHSHERWNPCPNPVTLDELNLPILLNYPYTFAEKTDGVRVQLIYCNPNRTIYTGLIDRKGNIYKLELKGTEAETLQGSDFFVLDGEIVQGFKDNVFYFVMFDCIFANNRCLRYEKDLFKRLRQGHECLKKLPSIVNGNLHLCSKQIRELEEDLDTGIFSSLPYPNDGLIFTPKFFEIPVETSQFLLKWKKEEHQSLDFRLVGHPPVKTRTKWGIELKFRFHNEERNIFQGFWFAGYKLKKVRCIDNAELQSILESWNASFDPTVVYPKNHFNCIVEVGIDKLDLEMDQEMILLKVLGIRHDKSSPNSELTIHGTLKTLLFPLSLPDLTKMIKSTLGHKNKILMSKRARLGTGIGMDSKKIIPLPSEPFS